MLVIRVYGFSKEDSKFHLFEGIREYLKGVIADIKGLNIDKDHIKVSFPEENWAEGLGNKIIVFVGGMREIFPASLELAKTVKEEIVNKVITGIKKSFPKTFILTSVRTLNPDDPDDVIDLFDPGE